MSEFILPPTREEHERLKKRAIKYLNYALGKKGQKDKKANSLVLMIAGERQRAVTEYKTRHYYKPMSRWQHIKEAFRWS